MTGGIMTQTSKNNTKNKEASNVEDQAAKKPGATIRWDGSKMKSTYANVCNVSSTQEEVILLFGTNQSWHSGQEELVVELSDRVILNPYAAKRLSLLLSNIIGKYESSFGALQIEAGQRQADTKE